MELLGRRTGYRFLIPLIVTGTLGFQVESGFAGTKQFAEGFETSPPPGWIADGHGAGFESGKGLAHGGQGNAWVGLTPGPDAISTWLDIPKYSLCKLQVWIKLSPGFAEGSVYARGGNGNSSGSIIKEMKLPQLVQVYPNPTEYNLYAFDFNSGSNTKIEFTVGLNAKDENAWERLDDFGVSCKTPL